MGRKTSRLIRENTGNVLEAYVPFTELFHPLRRQFISYFRIDDSQTISPTELIFTKSLNGHSLIPPSKVFQKANYT
jgi:hypothetical protein